MPAESIIEAVRRYVHGAGDDSAFGAFRDAIGHEHDRFGPRALRLATADAAVEDVWSNHTSSVLMPREMVDDVKVVPTDHGSWRITLTLNAYPMRRRLLLMLQATFDEQDPIERHLFLPAGQRETAVYVENEPRTVTIVPAPASGGVRWTLEAPHAAEARQQVFDTPARRALAVLAWGLAALDALPEAERPSMAVNEALDLFLELTAP